MAGGTGFYIQAVLYDVEFTENQGDTSYRNCLIQQVKEMGTHAIYEKLQQIDPESAEVIHENNVKRVIRALEYFHFTGEKFSTHNEQQRRRESPYSFLYAVLTMNRVSLYERIDRRVDLMMEEGLVNEVRNLLDRGYSRELVSMQGLGYKEIVSALLGEITMEEAVYQLKRNTRHFAKRQMTWFRREKEVTLFNKDEYGSDEQVVQAILNEGHRRGIL